MRAKRFSEEQIIGVLREADSGAKTKELCRRHGISEATFYNWKAKYAGMAVSEARRLKELQQQRREWIFGQRRIAEPEALRRAREIGIDGQTYPYGVQKPCLDLSGNVRSTSLQRLRNRPSFVVGPTPTGRPASDRKEPVAAARGVATHAAVAGRSLTEGRFHLEVPRDAALKKCVGTLLFQRNKSDGGLKIKTWLTRGR